MAAAAAAPAASDAAATASARTAGFAPRHSSSASSATIAAVAPAAGAGPRAATASANAPSACSAYLEEPDGAPVLVDVDVERRRRGAEPGHRLHVAEQRHEPAGAGVRADVAHCDGE